MDRNPGLPEGGARTVSLAVAGCGEPADTWRGGRRTVGAQEPSLPFSLSPCSPAGQSPTTSCTSEVVWGTLMGMMTWPLPSVFCGGRCIAEAEAEAEPVKKVAETLTGMLEAREPDTSRTRAWVGGEGQVKDSGQKGLGPS